MSIEQAIFQQATHSDGLSALIDTRIYPVKAPQETSLPYIVYTRISSAPISLLATDTDIYEPRFQFNCYAKTYTAACEVAIQLRLAFQRWRTTDDFIVLDTFLENEQTIFDETTQIYGVLLDFQFQHRE